MGQTPSTGKKAYKINLKNPTLFIGEEQDSDCYRILSKNDNTFYAAKLYRIDNEFLKP